MYPPDEEEQPPRDEEPESQEPPQEGEEIHSQDGIQDASMEAQVYLLSTTG